MDDVGVIVSLPSSPTSDGAAAAILSSEDFVLKYGLQDKAVEIVAQEMMTDLPSTFEEKSIIKMVYLRFIFFIKLRKYYFKLQSDTLLLLALEGTYKKLDLERFLCSPFS